MSASDDSDIKRLCELAGVSLNEAPEQHPPIVEVKTVDNISLNGLYVTVNSSKVLIAVHGTASNFYEEDFINEMTEVLPKNKWALLSTNNRGCGVLSAWNKNPDGAAVEKFEDCLLDIDAWIEFALKEGYKKIVLQGHSLGAEKVVYYMNAGKHANEVAGVILLGPADSFEYQQQFMQEKGITEMLFNEARKLVSEKRGYQFLTSYWLSHFDACPMDASSFLDFFENGSILSTVLPFKAGKLPMVKKIKLPMLAVIGNVHEFTVVPVEDAMQMLEKNNNECETHVLACDHDFSKHEKELVKIIKKFLGKV